MLHGRQYVCAMMYLWWLFKKNKRYLCFLWFNGKFFLFFFLSFLQHMHGYLGRILTRV